MKKMISLHLLLFCILTAISAQKNIAYPIKAKQNKFRPCRKCGIENSLYKIGKKMYCVQCSLKKRAYIISKRRFQSGKKRLLAHPFSKDKKYRCHSCRGITTTGYRHAVEKRIYCFTCVPIFSLILEKKEWGMPSKKPVPISATDGILPETKEDKSQQKEPIHKFPTLHSGPMCFSPNGKIFARNISNSIELIDVDSGKTLRKYNHNNQITSLAFRYDNKILVSGSLDKTARIWEYNNSDLALTPRLSVLQHSKAVTALAISPDGKLLLTGCEDGKIRFWDMKSGELLGTQRKHSKTVSSLCFSPDGRFFASGSHDKVVMLWKTRGKRIIKAFLVHRGIVACVAFSPDGNLLASGSLDDTIKIWDVSKNVKILVFEVKAHSRGVSNIVFSPISKLLVSSGTDGSIRIFDVKTGKQVDRVSMYGGAVNALAFHPSKRLLAIQRQNGERKLWDVQNRREIHNPFLKRMDLVQNTRDIYTQNTQHPIMQGVPSHPPKKPLKEDKSIPADNEKESSILAEKEREAQERLQKLKQEEAEKRFLALAEKERQAQERLQKLRLEIEQEIKKKKTEAAQAVQETISKYKEEKNLPTTPSLSSQNYIEHQQTVQVEKKLLLKEGQKLLEKKFPSTIPSANLENHIKNKNLLDGLDERLVSLFKMVDSVKLHWFCYALLLTIIIFWIYKKQYVQKSFVWLRNNLLRIATGAFFALSVVVSGYKWGIYAAVTTAICGAIIILFAIIICWIYRKQYVQKSFAWLRDNFLRIATGAVLVLSVVASGYNWGIYAAMTTAVCGSIIILFAIITYWIYKKQYVQKSFVWLRNNLLRIAIGAFFVLLVVVLGYNQDTYAAILLAGCAAIIFWVYKKNYVQKGISRLKPYSTKALAVGSFLFLIIVIGSIQYSTEKKSTSSTKHSQVPQGHNFAETFPKREKKTVADEQKLSDVLIKEKQQAQLEARVEEKSDDTLWDDEPSNFTGSSEYQIPEEVGVLLELAWEIFFNSNSNSNSNSDYSNPWNQERKVHVRGHRRHYKSGKSTWVDPHTRSYPSKK